MIQVNPNLCLSNTDGVSEYNIASKVSDIDSYKLKECCTNIKDQGDSSICASISTLEAINYLRLLKGEKKLKVSDSFFYENRLNRHTIGMSIREALDIAADCGYINKYSIIRNMDYIKSSILHNGPCIIGLPVYKTCDDFWKGDKNNLLGYHAVVLVGFNKDGFLLKNSWGTWFGDNGIILLPYKDQQSILEAWAIMF